MTSVRFTRVEVDQTAPDGPHDGFRYATDWVVETESAGLSVEQRFRVSSVSNNYTTETMLFRIEKDGVNYFDLWADREFYSNPSQHANFLSEFLDNRTP